MGVYSDGSYGIQPGLIYSFPVTCEKGEWHIVQGTFSSSSSSYIPYRIKYMVSVMLTLMQ